MRWHLSSNTSLFAVVFLSMVLLIVALTITSVYEVNRVIAASDVAAAYTDIGFAERDSLVALLNEETGVRGYVATGNPVFLEPYRNGKSRLERDRMFLARANIYDPTLRDAVTTSMAVGVGVERFLMQEIDDTRHGRRGAASAALLSGKLLFDEFRREDDIAQDITLHAVSSVHSTHASVHGRAILVLVAVGLVGIAATIVLSVLLRRGWSIEGFAYRDMLTGLPNRRLFNEHLDLALTRARRDRSHVNVLYFDLDGFKPVNDRFGHAAGDVILREAGSRIAAELRMSDVVSRVGGDEFTAFFTYTQQKRDPSDIIARVSAALHRPFIVRGQQISVGCTIGSSSYPDDGEDTATLVASADAAMYREKQRRRTGRPIGV